jgi:hypothetical protein
LGAPIALLGLDPAGRRAVDDMQGCAPGDQEQALGLKLENFF